jgi:hypothetical protein
VECVEDSRDMCCEGYLWDPPTSNDFNKVNLRIDSMIRYQPDVFLTRKRFVRRGFIEGWFCAGHNCNTGELASLASS